MIPGIGSIELQDIKLMLVEVNSGAKMWQHDLYWWRQCLVGDGGSINYTAVRLESLDSKMS